MFTVTQLQVRSGAKNHNSLHRLLESSSLVNTRVFRLQIRDQFLIWLLCGLVLGCSVSPVVAGEQAGKRRVVRGIFTTDIENREPVDQVLVLTNDHDVIYFFTDLRHFEGETVTHRWEYENNLVSEKKFEVGGPRWRVYSRKQLNPRMTGRWSVVVTDGKGWPIYAAMFDYVDKNRAQASSAILAPDE